MEQNGLFQFSIDNALELILVFNDSGIITYANQAAKNQLEYGENLKGTLITEIFPGDLVIEDGCLIKNWEDSDELREMMVYRKNRTCFPAKMRISTYGQYPWDRAYICMAYDIIDTNLLKKVADQAGQEAEEALKVKTEFVANVTHELRTPVNGILGNTQELLELETDAGKLKLLNLVERGCRDMHAIINNILDFSKLDAGKFVLEPRRFHFRNMIDYVKGNHSNRIIEKGLDFSMTISSEIPEYIIGDELRIVQVLNNLISNAYKFTSVGQIHVEAVKTATSGNRIELFFMVIDTGIGIAKADQEKLFKSFSQVDASISRKYGGTGLGLNISKQLVELMGGDIHVESEAGKGSIFSFHVWVEIPEEDCSGAAPSAQEQTESTMEQELMRKLQSLTESTAGEKIFKYGEPENKKELESKMSKLILSLEMENWEKAEMFTETVKQLVEEAPREIKSAALRLKMAVQKGDYEKAVTAFETLQNLL
ncbi:MAG: hypothetical protein IJ282_06850 [Lachnospiraceae bacterium]|nr:hypothetical protein [Lachnospiraceae bacterium]